MGSSKIKSQVQHQGHVISALVCIYKRINNKNITWQHGLIDLVYRCVNHTLTVTVGIYVAAANTN